MGHTVTCSGIRVWTALGRGHYIRPAPKPAAADGRAVPAQHSWDSLCLDGTEEGWGGGRESTPSSPHPTPSLLCTWPVISPGPEQDSPTGRKRRRRADVK